ncbi:MAG: hypothetical protein B1H04_05155 [Planctomycetales bacterium 4484_123]|nr:MAG: hypothetical protein B1H04_05155 [Planctomycetales bacterium 4484_123]
MAEVKTVLALDVGNSRVAMGAVGEGVTSSLRLPRENLDGLGEALGGLWEQMPEPRCVAACSVNPANLAKVESAVRERLGQDVLVVGRDLPLPMQTDLPEPHSIGTDRLCSAAMAYFRLQTACVVADFGTAITIDCVNDQGVFLGGAILPGLEVAAEALARRTALLPEVQPARPEWVFGKDTRQAIVGGLVYGARGALRELTEAYATELGRWPPVIATGGDAELVAAGYDIVHAVVPDLSLLGVALAYQKTQLEQE